MLSLSRVRSLISLFLLALTAAAVAAACSSGSETSVDSTGAPPTTQSPPTTADVPTEVLPRTEVAIVDDADSDWGLPSELPEEPVGSLGFDRYVFVQGDTDVIPIVVEGPREGAVRCQDPELPCSYADLKALQESGDAIPDNLNMSAAQLEELVGQLDQTAATVTNLNTPSAACAAGYSPVSAQNPNMGMHFVNTSLLADGFDPANPEFLLYANESGLGLTRDQLGDCDGDTWTGLGELQAVGSAFFIDLTDEHPETFAGPLDNWHIHYNSCGGAQLDSAGSQQACDEFGGSFFEIQRNWMIHTYVAPDYDSQTGVFAMWNDSVWPLTANSGNAPGDADVQSEIVNFDFGDVTAAVGDRVVITNRDDVPHQVEAGSFTDPSGAFSSEIIGTDSGYEVSFDEPGSYDYFCSLHPSMTGTITVE